MAVYPPLTPYNLGAEDGNDVYKFILDEYRTNGTYKWDVDFLVDEFGYVSFKEVVKYGILVESRAGTATLSFKILGTAAHQIKKFIGREIMTFKELQNKLPKSSKVTSHKLKQYIAFLENFTEAQLITLAGSAIPVIGADSKDGGCEEIEAGLDKCAKWTDRLNPRHVFQMSVHEGVEQYQT